MLRQRIVFFSILIMGVVFILLTTMNLWSDNQSPQWKDKIIFSSNLEQFRQALNSLSFKPEQMNLTIAAELAKNLTDLHNRHMRDDALPQKCKIPVLDPYHPDVKPFIKRWSVPDCKYPELSEVTDDGLLRVSGN